MNTNTIVNYVTGEVITIPTNRFNKLLRMDAIRWCPTYGVFVIDDKFSYLALKDDGHYHMVIINDNPGHFTDIIRRFDFDIVNGDIVGMNTVMKHNILESEINEITRHGDYIMILYTSYMDIKEKTIVRLDHVYKVILKGYIDKSIKLNTSNISYAKFIMMYLDNTSSNGVVTDFLSYNIDDKVLNIFDDKENRIQPINNIINKYYIGKKYTDVIYDIKYYNRFSSVDKILYDNTIHTIYKNAGLMVINMFGQKKINISIGGNRVSFSVNDEVICRKNTYTLVNEIFKSMDRTFINIIKKGSIKPDITKYISSVKNNLLSYIVTCVTGLVVKIPKHGDNIYCYNNNIYSGGDMINITVNSYIKNKLLKIIKK